MDLDKIIFSLGNLSLGDLAALGATLVALVWGAVRMSIRTVQGALVAGAAALAWYRRPSRVAVVEQHMTLMRGQFDQLLGALGETVKDAKPNGEPELTPLWLSDPQRRDRDRDRQHQAKTG